MLPATYPNPVVNTEVPPPLPFNYPSVNETIKAGQGLPFIPGKTIEPDLVADLPPLKQKVWIDPVATLYPTRLSALPSTSYVPTMINNPIPALLTNKATNPLFAPYGIENVAISSLTGLIKPELTTSTIIVDEINVNRYLSLDNAILTANNTELLLNGVPLATTSNISSIADWSLYPMISSLRADNQDISGVNIISGYGSAFYDGLFSNQLQVYSNVLTPQIGVNQVNAQNIVSHSISTFYLSTATLATSSLTTNNLTANNITTNTINGTSNFDASQWAHFSASEDVKLYGGKNIVSDRDININAPIGTLLTSGYGIGQTAGQIDIVADRGAAVGLNTNLNITSRNGYRGIVNLRAEPGYQGLNGTVNIEATGGTIGGIGQGGRINITAYTPFGLSNLTSAVSISGGGLNLYAGTVTPIASVFGYNFLFGSAGITLCATLPPSIPNVPGTIYHYAPAGVTFGSDVYLTNVYPYWNGVGSVSDLQISGRTVGMSHAYTVLSNCRDIYFENNATLHNPINIYGAGSGVLNGFNSITGSSGYFSNLNVSTINGSPPLNQYISSFGTASISSLTVSTINGSSPLLNYISSFGDLHTSTFTAYTGNFTSDLYAPTVHTENITSQTTLAVSALNDITMISQAGGQLFLGSQYSFPGGAVIAREINASTINCYALNVSSINGIAQPGFVPF